MALIVGRLAKTRRPLNRLPIFLRLHVCRCLCLLHVVGVLRGARNRVRAVSRYELLLGTHGTLLLVCGS